MCVSHRDASAHVSQILGLKACVTTSGLLGRIIVANFTLGSITDRDSGSLPLQLSWTADCYSTLVACRVLSDVTAASPQV